LSVPISVSPIAWIGCEVRADRAHEVAGAERFVLEREVDHSVSLADGLPQAIEVAAADVGAESGHGPGRRVGTGQTDDLVAVVQEFWDGGGGDVA
jgi:hypothetical protein